jgi:hypothetical protein
MIWVVLVAAFWSWLGLQWFWFVRVERARYRLERIYRRSVHH